MTDKTVTLPVSDWRTLAAFLDGPANITPDGDVAHIASRIKAALPPEWEEGTVARVHYIYEHSTRDYVTFAEWVDGEWRLANGVAALAHSDRLVRVEPLRVLGDDEIAVKLPGDWPSSSMRGNAAVARESVEKTAWNALADALEKAGR